jgi:lipopolysaccharide exporter
MKTINQLISRLRKNELYKNIFLLTSGNGLAQIIPLIVYPIITRLYTPSEFGALAFIYSVHIILVTLASGKYELAIILPEDKKSANNLFNVGMSIAIVISAIIPIVAFFTQNLVAKFIKIPDVTHWFYFLSITVVVTVYAILISGWCTRYKFFKIIIGYTLLLNFSTSILKLLFGLLKINDGLIISFIIAQVISSIYCVIAINRVESKPWFKLFQKNTFDTAKTYINFPKFTLPHELLNSISSNLPIFVLTGYFSEYITGQFSVAIALLFKPISIYANSVSQVLSQKVVELRALKQPVWPLLKKYIIRTLLIAILPALILIIFAPVLFTTILGNKWLEAGNLCQLLVPWSLVVLVGASVAFIPNVFNKQFKALNIDLIYLILRLGALFTGVFFNNAILGIGLFSLVGVVVICYQLIWYRGLVIRDDKINMAEQ